MHIYESVAALQGAFVLGVENWAVFCVGLREGSVVEQVDEVGRWLKTIFTLII